MVARFLMQALGKVQPLSFDGGVGQAPLAVSRATPWAGVPFELHATRPVEGDRDSGPPAGEQSALVVIEGSMDVVLREHGRDVRYKSSPGSFSLHASDDRPVLRRVIGSGKIMAVRIAPEWHERLLAGGAPARFSYQPPSAPDETIRALATAMCTEVTRGAPNGALFAESLSLAFLAYVVERLPSSPMRVRGALSDDQKRRICRYIEDRLHDDISVSELAGLCGLQARHFTTLFRRAFGRTPYRYVLDRRLARGAQLLVKSSSDVDAIALGLGFSSASHFTAEFRRAYGETPRRFARSRSLAL
jgi:AraC-like DNA-binding protein